MSFHDGSGSWARPGTVHDIAISKMAATRTKLIQYVFMDDIPVSEPGDAMIDSRLRGCAVPKPSVLDCLGRTRREEDRHGLACSASRSVDAVRYLPPPLAPCEIIATALSTVSVPDTWLGGYSLNVRRNRPTMLTAGTIVQSFSPHHLP